MSWAGHVHNIFCVFVCSSLRVEWKRRTWIANVSQSEDLKVLHIFRQLEMLLMTLFLLVMFNHCRSSMGLNAEEASLDIAFIPSDFQPSSLSINLSLYQPLDPLDQWPFQFTKASPSKWQIYHLSQIRRQSPSRPSQSYHPRYDWWSGPIVQTFLATLTSGRYNSTTCPIPVSL